MTAQLCAGNPPSFLEALTMPTVTQARASIDYDWDGAPKANGGPRSNNGAHNWAASDNAWYGVGRIVVKPTAFTCKFTLSVVKGNRGLCLSEWRYYIGLLIDITLRIYHNSAQ